MCAGTCCSPLIIAMVISRAVLPSLWGICEMIRRVRLGDCQRRVLGTHKVAWRIMLGSVRVIRVISKHRIKFLQWIHSKFRWSTWEFWLYVTVLVNQVRPDLFYSRFFLLDWRLLRRRWRIEGMLRSRWLNALRLPKMSRPGTMLHAVHCT